MGIKVSTLRKLLDEVPDYAIVSAYEGEDIGINIDDVDEDLNWWIRASYHGGREEPLFTKGFERDKNIPAPKKFWPHER